MRFITEIKTFAALGKERIAAEFPFMFVYPFNRL